MIKTFTIKTQERYQLVDITRQVESYLNESNCQEGLCLVSVAHSTAAIIMTENEPGLAKDWLKILHKIVRGESFEHDRIDNNADSHLLSGFLGQSKALPVKNMQLLRGKWQQIFLVELDGPRNRDINVSIFPSRQ